MKKLNLTKSLFLSIFLIYANIANGQIITTFAGTGVPGFSGDWGPPTAAQLDQPGYISFGLYEGFGSLYIDDASNNRIRQIKMGGIIYTLAGNGGTGFSGDGGQATAASFNRSGGTVVDKHNNTYIADQYNHVIRKVSPLGIISTIAGTPGVSGYYGDGGPATAAQFNRPYCVVMDTIGNLYIPDQYNQCIRKIDTSGTISTFAGTPMVSGYYGDGGQATAAKMSYPNYVRADTLGQLFITDNGNQRIRKVDASGIITTIAGIGVAGFSGDGGPATNAEIQWPGGICMDSHGNIYICDVGNNRVRMVDKLTGNINTVVGTGTVGYSGDGGPATAAELNSASDIAIDDHNNLYIADWMNNVIRKVDALYPPTIVKDIENKSPIFKAYPNPTSGIMELEWNNLEKGNSKLSVTNMIGREVYDIQIIGSDGEKKIDISDGKWVVLGNLANK